MQARRTAAAVLLLLSPWCWHPAFAQSAAPTPSDLRYISDETAITLREDKGMNAPVAALLKAGTRVHVIEDDAASGYSRVRVPEGREGWVLTRYLSNEPAARERLAQAQAQLAEQAAQLRRLEADNARLREAARPPGEAPAPAAAPAAPVADPVDLPPLPPGSEPVVMATGAGLFVAGLLAGLLIPLIGRPRRRASGPR